jgi:hypothetical protein
MNQKEQLLQLAEQFRNAGNDLALFLSCETPEEILDLFGTEYPFGESFDDIVEQINNWVRTMKEITA